MILKRIKAIKNQVMKCLFSQIIPKMLYRIKFRRIRRKT